MAFGFTPKHQQDIFFNDCTDAEMLVAAFRAANRLEWQVQSLSEKGFLAYTDNGQFRFNANIRFMVENGIASIESASAGNEMADLGKNKKTVRSFLAILEEEKNNTEKEQLAEQYRQLSAQFLPANEDPLQQTATEGGGFLSLFVPRKGFFVTPLLIDINILIFIFMLFAGVDFMQPGSQSLLNWGANFRPYTLDGDWWRLLTNVFLHIGIFHLLLNMYALLYIGVLLEPLLGSTRFMVAYLLAGIIASVTSLWWHEMTISAGASGAIFGMYGVFLALLSTNLIEKTTRKALLTSIGIFVGYNLLYGMKGGIDNAAHIGGLVSGAIIGFAFIPGIKKPESRQLTTGMMALLSLLVVATTFFALQKIPNDVGIYDKKIKAFFTIEEKAMSIYRMADHTSEEKLAATLKEEGIPGWKEGLALINSFDKLKLPAAIVKRNQILKEYCTLRIKSYELMLKALNENSDVYAEDITNYNKEIEAKINELSEE